MSWRLTKTLMPCPTILVTLSRIFCFSAASMSATWEQQRGGAIGSRVGESEGGWGIQEHGGELAGWPVSVQTVWAPRPAET